MSKHGADLVIQHVFLRAGLALKRLVLGCGEAIVSCSCRYGPFLGFQGLHSAGAGWEVEADVEREKLQLPFLIFSVFLVKRICLN